MVIKTTIKSIQQFIKLESASGIILFFMAILALILDNSPLQYLYTQMQEVFMSFQIGYFKLGKPLILWVNDGLMAIFFFLVGLEIKREILEGELNTLSKLALPGIAAIGGMVVPAMIFLAFNFYHPEYVQGWAIPSATDIAFALGVLSLLGSRVPSALKVYLTALAILDDLGAIIIIAAFYTKQLSMMSLGFASLAIIALFVLNRLGVRSKAAYLLVGFMLWVFVLKSGVHATLAGVVLAFAIPIREKGNPQVSPLREIEHALHPWVAFLVLPVFAFFNAGVSFSGVTIDTFLHPIPLGIAMGLFFGKQIGVFGFSWLAVKSKLAQLPNKVDWTWIYGVSLICGIGFTMSLFIGTLAYKDLDLHYAVLVRLGVLLGSFAAGLMGYLVLLQHSSRQVRVDAELSEGT